MMITSLFSGYKDPWHNSTDTRIPEEAGWGLIPYVEKNFVHRTNTTFHNTRLKLHASHLMIID
jgi:hypothetical protein